MKFHHYVAAVAASAILSACASSDVVTVKPAAGVQSSNIRVTKVVVKLETPRPNPRLQHVLTAELEKRLAACARGNAPHVVQVTINEFEDQNVAKSILIGDEIELAGRVRFVSAKSGKPAGEYYVNESFFWGGLAGAALMSDAERSLSRDFANTVCKRILGVAS